VSRGFRSGKRRYTYDEHFFDKIDTEEKAYFLGLLYADGSVSKKGSVRLRLHEKDLDTVISFSNALKSTYPIKFEASKCPNRGNVYGVTLWCQYLVNILSGLGCVPNKTFKLVFPDFLDPKLYNHFIRGYFDGDGCILRNKKHAFSLVGTESFLLTVKEIMVDTLGLSDLPLKTRHPERNNNIRSLVYSGRKVALKIKDWLYRDATVYMKRKYEIFQSIPTNPKYKRKRNKKIEV
jgi:hypothetical protein